MSETFVKSFTHLKDRPYADKALPMLQRVASLVKPIMRKHKWVLPVLSEFFPESPNLVGLNVNGGQKILLRLRPAHAPDTFYDEEDVVRVMLHELAHNVHGPHDENFYKFLSELEAEYEALKRSGYSGEGFYSKGKRVGDFVSHNLPPHLARARALEAAEKRRRLGNMLGGARRLGGAVVSHTLSPRELAVQAAERRVRDEQTCASGADARREAEKAASESIEDEIIDLTADSDPEIVILDQPLPSGDISKVAAVTHKSSQSKTPAASASPSPSRSPGYQAKKPSSRVRTTSLPRQKTPPPSPLIMTSGDRSSPWRHNESWACPRCTLVNEPLALQCGACMLIRPLKSDPVEGWVCMRCGQGGMPHAFWSCSTCGSIKEESACG